MRFALSGITLIIFSLTAIYLASVGLSPGGAPSVMGRRLLIVLTGSMTPTFRAGDMIAVSEVDVAQVSVGDVITFRDALDPSILVTHRVVKVIRDGEAVFWKTRGDANGGPDPTPVAAADLMGRVDLIFPYAGYLASFARTGPGFLLLIVIPGVVLLWMLTERRKAGQE